MEPVQTPSPLFSQDNVSRAACMFFALLTTVQHADLDLSEVVLGETDFAGLSLHLKDGTVIDVYAAIRSPDEATIGGASIDL